MKKMIASGIMIVYCLLCSNLVMSQENQENQQPRGRKGQREPNAAPSVVRGLPASLAGKEYIYGKIILGRPTNQSITISILMDRNCQGYIEYGIQTNKYTNKSKTATFPAEQPVELFLSSLQPSTQYFYRVCYRESPSYDFQKSKEYTFHTQRKPDETFTFAVQADPHGRDANVNFTLYEQTLNNELADQTDFLIDLGDTFMSDKFATDADTVLQLHAEQRPYFGLVCHSTPLYLVLGNHEGEAGWLLNGTSDNLAVCASQVRTTYYPNPVPDGFYTGDTTDTEFVGLRGSYYAWEWGNALFVVLDPYFFTTRKPKRINGDNWQWTLGTKQYQWFKNTLQKSKAKFKFVFAHQLVGGADSSGRGGIEFAKYYEWGGKNIDGSWGFDTKRPGWGKPIHQLMVENHVTIFFHGHDHLFVKQDLDGVVYQEVPQPSHSGSNQANMEQEYGYVQGKILSSPGHLRVTVSPDHVTVDYVQSSLQKDSKNSQNKKTAFSYTISNPK